MRKKTLLDKDEICEQIINLPTADQLYVKAFTDKAIEDKAKAAEAEIKLIKEKS